MSYILVEDECAPDSMWYFEKQLKEKFGLSITEFKEKGRKESSGDRIAYYYKGYVLESFADAPQWH